MQASVHRYGGPDGETTLVTDDGRTLTVPAAVLAAAGLRTLRVGQRLAVTVAADGVDGADGSNGQVAAVAIPALAPREQPGTREIP